MDLVAERPAWSWLAHPRTSYDTPLYRAAIAVDFNLNTENFQETSVLVLPGAGSYTAKYGLHTEIHSSLFLREK